jgi:hypothetical protein
VRRRSASSALTSVPRGLVDVAARTAYAPIVPRNLTVSYPNGESEYWFTERVFVPGDTVELKGSTWVVVAIGGSVDPEGDKHSRMIVREHTEGAENAQA